MSNDYNGKKRSELPDSVFGIPQERKYPMPDEKHTRSAIKLFNHVDPKYEEQLAKAVIKNMKKYGIDGSVVGPNNRLRKYLPKDMLKESSIEEGFLKSDKDIYYNKDKFDSGEINLCFITGLSGSGKSTMGRNMSSKNIEHYEMDDVICNDNFSDDNLKEYGGLISSFFKGAGKSFRLIQDDDKHNDSVFNTHKNYEKEITQAFVKHAISYCKSHKETKYVCDGIWIFMFIKPEQLKDCAVYIKGTSSIRSGYRALKRDIDEDKRNGMTSLQIFKHEFKRVKEDILYARENQKELKSFRSYFEKQSTNESVSSTVSKDHKQKGYISLSSLKKVHITESVINKYKKEYPVLRHVRCKDTNEYICDGYMWFKENDLVCYVGSCQYTDDHTKWIVSLEIIPKYRGYGLSNQILDYCVKSMKCKYLSVNKNNELAKKIYDKYGFRVYHEDNTMYYMTIDKSIKESSILPQDTGISTVIFDIGDVLVSANIKDYLMADPEIPNDVIDELLKLWFIDKDEVDDTMDLDTYREIVNKRMGTEFSKYAPNLFKANIDCVNTFDYTIPMIQDLKDKGYKVYYLSNWSAWTHDLLQEAGKFDFLKLMDGGVFSYDVGYMKPNEEIYKILLNKYKINPEEAIFFDDREENIEAANKLRIHGVHFPRHDASIVYNNLYGRKLAKAIYEDMDNIRYDFDHSYNDKVLEDAYLSYMNEISLGVKVDEDKVAKEILNIIRPIIISQDNKSKASKMGLSLKCEIDEVDSGMVIILVLDGTQDKRDTDDARIMLKELASKCKAKLSNLVSKIDIGDGDEGCLYFTMNKGKIKKNRKDLIKESTNEEIAKSEINDIKEIISILNDDDFKNFKFTNIAYCDIRYRNNKPIAFITIRTKPINNYIVGFVSLAVIPKYQNQGIGRSLTEKAVRWFKKNKGIDFLEWHCLPNNAASNKLANDAGFSKYIAKDDGEYNTYTMESVIETNISEYGTTRSTTVGANQPLYFYHMVDSGANLSKGLLSLGYMYHHNKPLFLKNASKYRNRLCDGWGIYPGRDPKSLTAEEIYEGIKKFRNEDNLNSIYFFKYPPYSSLDKRFDRLYKYKKLYRININDTKVKSIIKNINYGWIDSNTYNDPLDRKYYETISPEDYFNNFDPDKGLLFSTLYHISIEVKNGYIPMRLLEEVKVPNTIEDIISMEESSIQEYGTTGGTIVGANQPDSVYIVNYMQNNVFSGYKEPKQAICKKGMNQMYTTKNGKAVPVDKDKFKEEASDISVFRFKETPILSFDKIIENASVDEDFFLLLTGDFPEDRVGKLIEYDNRFVQEENFLDELDDITCCTESTITGQIETSNYPYMKVLTESVQGRCWNYYRDINGVFAMNELTGLRTPSYEDVMDIPKSQIKLIERGTVYLGE